MDGKDGLGATRRVCRQKVDRYVQPFLTMETRMLKT
jgi:hypothetical protein